MDPNDPSVVSVVEQPAAKQPAAKHPGGRPKGSPNRNTETSRFLISQLINGLLPSAYASLIAIRDGTPVVRDVLTGKVLRKGTAPNPKGFVDALTSLMDFNLPRLARVEVRNDVEPEPIVIGADVTPDEAERLYLKMVGQDAAPIEPAE